MFSFEDHGEQLTLRPEGTASVVRALLTNNLLMGSSSPKQYYYYGSMFRHERPQKGRLREFSQFGIESFGSSSFLSDIEMIDLAFSFLQRLQLDRSITLEVNSLGDGHDREVYQGILESYLTSHIDLLSSVSKTRLLKGSALRILDSKDPKDHAVVNGAPMITDHLGSRSRARYEAVLGGLNRLGIPFVENPRLVRGLDYYTETIFEFKSNLLGAQDTVLAGGRYDDLVSVMSRNRHTTPAIGWAAGVDRLALLLDVDIPNSVLGLIILPDPAISAEGLSEEAAFLGYRLARMLRVGRSVLYWPSEAPSKALKALDREKASDVLFVKEEDLKRVCPGQEMSVPGVVRNLSTRTEKSVVAADV